MNRVTLVGKVGADPEIKNTNGGQVVARLRIATTERYKDRGGEWKESTEWHNVVIWGGLCSVVEQYVRKGGSVMVEGALKTRKWQDQQGQERYSTEVVLSGPGANLILMGGGQRQGDGQQRDGGTRQRAEPARQRTTHDLDDEIPF